MRSWRAIAGALLAVGLLLSCSVNCAPDAMDDDDIDAPCLDLAMVELVPAPSAAVTGQISQTVWQERADTGREYSAAIFHPPI